MGWILTGSDLEVVEARYNSGVDHPGHQPARNCPRPSPLLNGVPSAFVAPSRLESRSRPSGDSNNSEDVEELAGAFTVPISVKLTAVQQSDAVTCEGLLPRDVDTDAAAAVGTTVSLLASSWFPFCVLR